MRINSQCILDTTVLLWICGPDLTLPHIMSILLEQFSATKWVFCLFLSILYYPRLLIYEKIIRRVVLIDIKDLIYRNIRHKHIQTLQPLSSSQKVFFSVSLLIFLSLQERFVVFSKSLGLQSILCQKIPPHNRVSCLCFSISSVMLTVIFVTIDA